MGWVVVLLVVVLMVRDEARDDVRGGMEDGEVEVVVGGVGRGRGLILIVLRGDGRLLFV